MFSTTCMCPRKNGYGRISSHILKCVRHIYNFIFDLIHVCLLPWAVCVKSLVNESNGFEDVALNMDTKKTQNLELLLDAVDFAKFLVMKDFKHYDLHKAVGHK